MGRWIFLSVAIVLLAILALSFLNHPQPCGVALEYRIGAIDPRFGVSDAEYRADVKAAAAVWSKAVGHDLFRYNPDATLTVNLVYDWRQAATQSELTAETAIAHLSARADSVKARLHAEIPRFDGQKRRHEAEVEAYNNEVQHWNSIGGAPREVGDGLMMRQRTLNREARAINETAARLNAMVGDYNTLVKQINAETAAINSDGLAGTEFLKGFYQRTGDAAHIDIYQFRRHDDLLLVLAHELGHALGLAHNLDPKSIMSPILQTTDLRLSSADRKALEYVCRR